MYYLKIITLLTFLMVQCLFAWADSSQNFLLEQAVDACRSADYDNAKNYFDILKSVYGDLVVESDHKTFCDKYSSESLPVQTVVEKERSFTPNDYSSDLYAEKEPPAMKMKLEDEKSDDLKYSKVYSKKAEKTKDTNKFKDVIEKAVIDLDTAKPEDYPRTIEITQKSLVQIKATKIRRYFAVDQNMLEIKRINDELIEFKANKYGDTYLHVWNQHGRWTFFVKVIVPRRKMPKVSMFEKADGFRFTHSYYWTSNSSGDSFNDLERNSLSIGQSLTGRGISPLGYLGFNLSWVRDNKGNFSNTHESFSIDEGKFLFLEDFRLDAFDVSGGISAYTLGGVSLRGIVFSDEIFNDRLYYKLIHGRESGSFFGESDVERKKEVFHDAFKLTLKAPNEKTFYSFNYAEANGDDRIEDAPDRVISVDVRHELEKANIDYEYAFDDEHTAFSFNASKAMPNSFLTFNFRNVEKDFNTVLGSGSYDGEIGGTLGWNYNPDSPWSYNANLGLYKDKEKDHTDTKYDNRANFNGSLGTTYIFKGGSSWSNSFSYTNMMAEVNKKRTYRFNSSYNKRYKFTFFKKDFSISSYLKYNFYRMVTPTSRERDYRRDGMSLGLSMPLTRNIYGSYTYQRTRLQNRDSADYHYPTLMTMGLNWHKYFNPKFSANSSIYYRKEDNFEARNSYLGGEDSVDVYLSANYMPIPEVDIYLDAYTRKIWSQRDSDDDRVESSIRLGSRISWESFIRWAPKTIIKGKVYVDKNSNGVADPDERGVPGVTIEIGDKFVKTDDEGYYKVKLRAKRVSVALDRNSLPAGHEISGNLEQQLDIAKGGTHELNYGVSTKSSISGVVFYDINQNKVFDKSDIALSGVRVRMDSNVYSRTNTVGIFYFANVKAGKHRVSLDMPSLPDEYIPTDKIRASYEVVEGVSYKFMIPVRKK